MAGFIAQPADSPQLTVFESNSAAGAPTAQTFATILSLLVKQILDLRETLEFYERYFCDLAYTDSTAENSKWHIGRMESDTHEALDRFA